MILRFKSRESYSDKFKTASEVMRETISAKFVGNSVNKVIVELIMRKALLTRNRWIRKAITSS